MTDSTVHRSSPSRACTRSLLSTSTSGARTTTSSESVQRLTSFHFSGIYTMQLFTYWKWARKDPVWTRLVVVATSGMAYVMTSE